VPAIERIDFVQIPTRNMERAQRFYRETLGLPPNRHASNEFEAGNVTLALWEPEKLGVEFRSNGEADVAFRVPDVAAARGELEAQGVEFVGETVDTGVCHMAFFVDPDGNSLMFHRRYAPLEEGHGEG
jgi:catechol 2,3-dioxygenase-like lactoylglutathione lyase family enzyme